MKLELHSILPRSVQRTIVLDVDLLLMKDIIGLWKHFERFHSTQIFGLVENQSPWYIPGAIKKTPWPALGRGVNTGVMLVDIKRLREVRANPVCTGDTRTFS